MAFPDARRQRPARVQTKRGCICICICLLIYLETGSDGYHRGLPKPRGEGSLRLLALPLLPLLRPHRNQRPLPNLDNGEGGGLELVFNFHIPSSWV